MITTQLLGTVGGLFALLALWHFFADWTFQSHKDAIAKSKDQRVRASHCIEYVFAFFPAWTWASLAQNNGILKCITIVFTLFFTHFIIDSYKPVAWWAKNVRHDPAFDQHPDDYETAMKAMMSTPVGAILCITMDQILHLACLVPVAIILAWH